MTLANVTISSVASTFPNSFLANSTATLGNATITLGSTTSTVGNLTLNNATINSGTVSITDATVSNSAVISVNTSGDALRITQTGTGNALVVEDSANPDSTPFVIDASGNVIVGGTSTYTTSGITSPRLMQSGFSAGSGQALAIWANVVGGGGFQFLKSRGTTEGSYTIVSDGDTLGQIRFSGADGTAFTTGALIQASVDGTPGTNDMPGRLTFSTTADGASSPTERMRITSAGAVGIGGTPTTGTTLNISKSITGSTVAWNLYNLGTIQSDVTSQAKMFVSVPTTAAAAFTLNNLTHFFAQQGTIGASSAVTNQYGFEVSNTLIGATNNYGFYSNIASGSGRWNFYANGTAANYFAGDMQLDKTVTAAGTTGAQTINKNAGTVNFAAAATSLVVTNNRVTANSIIICTVGTNDTTMKSVSAVAGAGSFTLHANAAATAETRVNFLIIN
jgi:hypothetical protein